MSRPNQSITIIEAIEQFFSRWFSGSSWNAWRTFLKTLFALPLDEDDAVTYTHHTNRQMAPEAPFREAWLVVGRRGGKSLIASVIAVYLAVFRDHSAHLTPGERGTISVIAADRRQARTILRYIRAFLDVDALNGVLVADKQESLELRNDIVIEVHTASFRTTRGYTLIAAIMDEIAFFRSEESANPDKEVVAAVRPGLATTNGLLLCISSPYARRGALWDAYSRHFGKDSRVLVWKGTTQEHNPLIAPEIIEQALQEDESSARAEYFAEFRRDIETFVSREVVNACTVRGRVELARGHFPYSAFFDASGGSVDSMTLGIAHRDRAGKFVLDCLRERRPPFSPDDVVREFAETLKSYGIRKVTGDRYAGEWPRERFQAYGIHCEISSRNKSEIYVEVLPLLNSSRVELLDNPRLLSQLLALERRTSSVGREIVDHPVGQHDDLINSAAGALFVTSQVGQSELGGIF
jgi:hypothetical protein